MTEDNSVEEVQFTKEQIVAFIKDIELRLVGNSGANLHSVVGLNRILRASNINQVLDNELKERIKDIWIKLKSTGLLLIDPPIVFGLPKDFESILAEETESEDVPELGEEEQEEVVEEEAISADDLPAVKKTRKKKEDKRDQIN